MKLPISAVALAATLLSSMPAPAQQPAGRVILATGTVAIVRGAERIPAAVGVPLRPGDTLEVGTQSHAQIYLTDESIISLRPETTFRIREYDLPAMDPSSVRAFFELLKGGMRTVTGLINRRENYRVNTPTATIGIRGTHYWLVSCSQDCRNKDGSLAPDGDYGLVREGRVGIAPSIKQAVFGSDRIMHVQAPVGDSQPTREFGSDQVFHVAAATGAARELIGPPPFLFVPIGTVQPPTPAVPTDVAKPKVDPKLLPDKPALVAPVAVSVPVLAPTGERGGTGDLRVTSTITDNTAFTFFNVKQRSATVAPLVDTVLQAASAISVQGPAAVLEPSFLGTVFYRLAGVGLNIPTSCLDSPPCDRVSRGQIVLGVNFALQRATIRADIELANGEILNFATPSALSGIPVVINGNQVTFNGTLNRVDFPQNSGAFRCSACGPGGTPGFADQLTFSGTITGSEARVTLAAVDAGGGGSLTATLPIAIPPNNAVAAMAVQRLDGGTDTRAGAFWNVQLDPSGRLLQFGPNDGVNLFGNRVGGPSGSVGTAANTIAGTAPAAGNLVWGMWTGAGAQLTDSNYDSYLSTSPTDPNPSLRRLSVQPWITGEAPNTLPPSLGILTYTPVGAVFTNANQVLNSALMTANFVARTVSVSVNATNTAGGNTYQMNGATGFSPTSSQFSSGFNSVTCSGPCNNGIGTPSGAFGGFFAGQQAQGAGLVVTAGFGAQQVVGNAGNGVTGAIGMKR